MIRLLSALTVAVAVYSSPALHQLWQGPSGLVHVECRMSSLYCMRAIIRRVDSPFSACIFSSLAVSFGCVDNFAIVAKHNEIVWEYASEKMCKCMIALRVGQVCQCTFFPELQNRTEKINPQNYCTIFNIRIWFVNIFRKYLKQTFCSFIQRGSKCKN